MTERKIQDYLHFYLGCDCEIAVIVPGQELSWDPDKLNIRWLHGSLNKLVEVKPILRPLSDMKNEDCPDWFNKWMPDGFEVLHQMATNYRWVEIDSNADDGYCLTIHQDGSMSCECKDNGEQYAYKGAEIFKHLLSLGFDLFNLIPDGLAINKSTIQK